MRPHPQLRTTFKNALYDLPQWHTRATVIFFAVLAGLTVVLFTWLTTQALALFSAAYRQWWWSPLLWTPAVTATIVWVTHRYSPGASGSGIPQVMAAQDHRITTATRGLFVSLRLSLSKMLLTASGLLAGLSLGREGPSVQIAAGVMHSAKRWLPHKSVIGEHNLLVAGGAAGIAAAFNTPLGGIMFALEELSRKPESRHHGLIVAAIVIAGLMGVSVYGNASHFGVIRIQDFGWDAFFPALFLVLIAGLLGGTLSRLLVTSLAGHSTGWFAQKRQQHPVYFAAGCGLLVAIIGVVTLGATFGSGYMYTHALLDGSSPTNATLLYTPLKLVATWLTAWSGVPGGIFAPSLSIGAALGNDVAQLTGYANAPTLIALGMVAFLAAVTQAPLTSFIIVMEMVNGHALVLSLMASALVATAISRLMSTPLYASLAELQLTRLLPPTPLDSSVLVPKHGTHP